MHEALSSIPGTIRKKKMLNTENVTTSNEKLSYQASGPRLGGGAVYMESKSLGMKRPMD